MVILESFFLTNDFVSSLSGCNSRNINCSSTGIVQPSTGSVKVVQSWFIGGIIAIKVDDS